MSKHVCAVQVVVTSLKWLGVITALAIALNAATALAQGGRILEYPEVEPSRTAYVEYMCHLQGFGDTNFYKQPLSCGTEGENRRLEGFMIRLSQGSENVGLRYMAHLEKRGDTGWKYLNEYVGTRG